MERRKSAPYHVRRAMYGISAAHRELLQRISRAAEYGVPHRTSHHVRACLDVLDEAVGKPITAEYRRALGRRLRVHPRRVAALERAITELRESVRAS